MIRALPYCVFRHRAGISLPVHGVQGAAIKAMEAGEARLLWSEVEWPLVPEHMRKNAVEFHEVVHHVFRQAAVAPFRLLSVFDYAEQLSGFIKEHAGTFLADLARLDESVQMECVIYPSPGRTPPRESSGAEYLRDRAELLREQAEHVNVVRQRLASLAREIHVREGRNGARIFVLISRGREGEFRDAVQQAPAPALLSRRVSGPWPAAEFLSEAVRAPQVAGGK